MASQAVLTDEQKSQVNAGVINALSSEPRAETVIRVLENLKNLQTSNVYSLVVGFSPSKMSVTLWGGSTYANKLEVSFAPEQLVNQQSAVRPKTFENQFYEQANKWARETAHLSSPTQRMMHPSYQAILGMARDDEETVIRLMLQDLRDNRRLWFWALSYLTKENPIKDADAGKLDKMIKAWVDWGKQRGKL